ncbi:MAG: hypothetical protein HWE39_05670 [Oceanospirillaceae bacterium]|nr:hypothetical protein [Oceanospirillaceae bacterium]
MAIDNNSSLEQSIGKLLQLIDKHNDQSVAEYVADLRLRLLMLPSVLDGSISASVMQETFDNLASKNRGIDKEILEVAKRQLDAAKRRSAFTIVDH